MRGAGRVGQLLMMLSGSLPSLEKSLTRGLLLAGLLLLELELGVHNIK